MVLSWMKYGNLNKVLSLLLPLLLPLLIILLLGKDLSKYNKQNYNTIDDLKIDLVKQLATVSSVAKKAGEESNFPFPKEGVTLKAFQQFIDDVCGGRDSIAGYTTTDVCNKCLISKMSENKTSYVQYLQSINDPEVGLASVFISHAWKYNFLDVYDALLNHFENHPNKDSIFIWFDLFSNNQRGAPSLSFLWWRLLSSSSSSSSSQ